MKNYIEHEQRVAYVDGLLAHSQEWNWMITYIETEFDVNFSMSGFKDFDSIYRQIGDVLQMLIKVNEIMKGRLVIHQPWLKEIDTLSLYYLGINDCDAHDLDTDFGKTLLLLMYLAKIRNEISKDDVKLSGRITSIKLLIFCRFRKRQITLFRRWMLLHTVQKKRKRYFSIT